MKVGGSFGRLCYCTLELSREVVGDDHVDEVYLCSLWSDEEKREVSLSRLRGATLKITHGSSLESRGWSQATVYLCSVRDTSNAPLCICNNEGRNADEVYIVEDM
eukprot:scaffold539_cov145-Skeletonema_menzelii.AAC.9